MSRLARSVEHKLKVEFSGLASEPAPPHLVRLVDELAVLRPIPALVRADGRAV